MQTKSLGLQLKDTFISFPYINSNKKSQNAIDQLSVDIKKPTSNITISLKDAYQEYYPQYDEYLKQQKTDTIYNEICNYFETQIKTPIKHKYKVGQFGYLNNDDTSERSFIMISEISDLKKDLFFLHCDAYLYKYTHYDITSTKPKLLKDNNLPNNWMKENEFIIIEDCIESVSKVAKLLNWKICREDYLTKKLQKEKQENKKIIQFRQISETKENDINTTDYYTISDYTTSDMCSDTDSICSGYNGYISHNNSIAQLSQKDTLEKNGYSKDKNLTQTLKGQVFIGIKKKKYNQHKNLAIIMEEPVAIKKVNSQNIIFTDAEVDLVRETLILRNLRSNEVIRNNIVNYIDFFKDQSDFYIVMELNFSVTLKEFVLQSHKYIKSGQLQISEYKHTIKYLLWRLIVTVHWLHNDNQMKSSDLDLCPENIMLRQADFVEISNGLLGINLQIEIKLIDIGAREIIEIGSKDKLKQFEYMYNNKYLAENEQYILPNNNNNNNNNNIIINNSKTNDAWAYGMIVYFCFFGDFPYKQIPSNTENISDNYGYYAISNDKLKRYLAMNNSMKYTTKKMLSLLKGILHSDPSQRLDIENILQHPWFNSFYKLYHALCVNN